MTARRLLYLDMQGLSAYQSWRGQLLDEGHFTDSTSSLADFARYLARHRQSHFSLLCNIAEESQALETIPFLQGSNRNALIERKISQRFPGSSLNTTHSLGYEQDQRKNEKLLLCALTDPQRLEPWLQQIDLAQAALSGIDTLSQLGGLLLQKLGHPTGHCLLLTQADTSIREICLVDGQPLFSRLAVLEAPHPEHLASSFVAEAAKLHQYLIGQRLIGRDENLTVWIMAHPQAMPAIRNACPDDGPLIFQLIDNQLAAARLGLRTPPEDSRCEALFLHLQGTAAPRGQFATPLHRQHFRLANIRKMLLAGAATAIIGSTALTAWMSLTAQNLIADTALLRESERELTRRSQQISANLPKLAIDFDGLRQVSQQHRDLQRQQGGPEQAYRLISQALDPMPAITLDSIDWNLTAFAQSTAEIITVQGQITPTGAASPRQVLAGLNQFIDRLRAAPGVTVRLMQSPVVVDADSSLRERDLRQTRPFVVEIRREINP
jgi:hypothetical protein